MRRLFVWGLFFHLLAAVWPGKLEAARQYWVTLDSAPWDVGSAKAIASFNNLLLVSAGQDVLAGSTMTGTWGLWSSADGRSWQSVTLPEPFYTVGFLENGGFLYAFTQNTLRGRIEDTQRIYRSSNGTEWQRADNFAPIGSKGVWVDSVIHNGTMFATNNAGLIFYSNGQGNPPAWQLANPFPPCDGCDLLSYGVSFQGYLYLASVYEYPGISLMILHRNQDPVNNTGWEYIGYGPDFSNEAFRSRFVVYQNNLYWGANRLWRTSGGPMPVRWEGLFTGSQPMPFIFNNQLHVAGPAGEIRMMTKAGNWEGVFQPSNPECVASEPKYGRSVQFQGATYILPCSLMSFTPGIHSVERDNFVVSPLSPGQKQVTVLAFATKVNSPNDRMRFRVQNGGTAQPGTDVEAAYLVHVKTNQPSPSLIPLALSSDRQSWLSPVEITIEDGDKFFVTVDVANTAVIDRTCLFSIPADGLQFAVRASFALSAPLTAPSALTITSLPPPASTVGPITDVLVYPHPARDFVRFKYTLTSNSDVRIEIYDRKGVLVSEIEEPGKAQAAQAISNWDASSFSPGVYYAVLHIQSTQGEKRFIKTKVVIER